jgi:ParB family chromosome partitioning protein
MHRPELLRSEIRRARKAKVAAKPELVQISTACKQQPEGEKTIPRNEDVEISEEKPDTSEKAKRPEFKTCKYTAEAIVADGIDKACPESISMISTFAFTWPSVVCRSA